MSEERSISGQCLKSKSPGESQRIVIVVELLSRKKYLSLFIRKENEGDGKGGNEVGGLAYIKNNCGGLTLPVCTVTTHVFS